MTEPSQSWTEADLQHMIAAQVMENIGLEYKAAASLASQDGAKREIAKDVSAFANSAGGILIYGMAENGHVPTSIEPIDPSAFSKEWLENVIISNVQPRIDGLHINPVQLTGANAGRVAYVITIHQSLTAHQAPDHRYYKRYNFQSMPMEHYEVQDTMNRSKTPIVNVRLVPSAVYQGEDLHRYSVEPHLDNKGSRTAQHLKLLLALPSALNANVSGHIANTTRQSAGLSGQAYEANVYEYRIRDAVLFPQDTIAFGQIVMIEVDEARADFLSAMEPKIEWTLFADDMVPRHGFTTFEFVSY